MNAVIKIRSILTSSIYVILLAGCALQLAPRYDAALYDGLTQVNTRIMEMFAAVSAGTEASDFAAREAAYNAIIGRLDALALQSRARPVPGSAVRDRVNEYLARRGGQPMGDDEAPSATALDQASRQLAKMKEVDQAGGLRPGAVAAFRNAVIISMDQAITYESFLDR